MKNKLSFINMNVIALKNNEFFLSSFKTVKFLGSLVQ